MGLGLEREGKAGFTVRTALDIVPRGADLQDQNMLSS